MGVYIKGIEMPKNCFDCEIFGLCSLKDRLKYIDDRNPDCPLVEIRTPHGRLIDADALFQDLREHNIPFNNDINSAINVAPTILEEEE